MKRRESLGGEQTKEQQRELWMQKATEAWNAAENAFQAVLSIRGRAGADEVFMDEWNKKCQEFQLGDLNLQWHRGVYGSTGSHEGSNYIFVRSTVDISGPLLRAAFDVSSHARQGNVRVQKPASMKGDIYAAIKGDLSNADEHEFEKGQLV